MAATYDLLKDFPSNDALINQAPYWVVGIVRFADQVTYTLSSADGDLSSSALNPVNEASPLVLTSEVVQMQTTSAKGAHVTNMTATLAPYRNFLSLIHSGDWVVACIVNDETKGLEIVDRMRNGQAINGWDDGLKFVGRVNSIFKTFAVSPDGVWQTAFNLQCVGFSEMDSQLYYNPQLEHTRSLPVSLSEFGTLLQDITKGAACRDPGGPVNINLVIPSLMNVIFGQGAWANAPGTANISASPNRSYLVPRTVGRWLGIESETYNDVIHTMIGLHHYQTVIGANGDTVSSPWTLFQPDGIVAEDGVLKTSIPLQGWFTLSAPPNQTTVWSVLSGYSNEPINEMYVTLRADPGGSILPFLVVRQTPYSTDVAKAFAANFRAEIGTQNTQQNGEGSQSSQQQQPQSSRAVQQADATDFLELPRWKLSKPMVNSGQIGRSDAMRFNFVWVVPSGAIVGQDQVKTLVDAGTRAPPIFDGVDILRSGVRPYVVSTNSCLRDLQNPPRFWRDIMADIILGQHLTFSGQLSSVGIQSPIACGDNLEFENLVFHIEAVSHSCSIQPNGTRLFNTTLALSHGVDGEGPQAVSNSSSPERDRRLARFPGLDDSQVDLAVSQENVSVDSTAVSNANSG